MASQIANHVRQGNNAHGKERDNHLNETPIEPDYEAVMDIDNICRVSSLSFKLSRINCLSSLDIDAIPGLFVRVIKCIQSKANCQS